MATPLCALANCLPLDLTHSGSTTFINLELTTRCNLQCVYCYNVGDAKKRGYDFQEDWIEPLLKTMYQRGLRRVSVHGTGETTVLKGWQNTCRSFLDKGFNLVIVSNFARPLTAEEVAVFARFSLIVVSIDTADPELFARIRRGARLETFLANIDRVRAHASSEGIRPPEFVFNSVVTDKTILGVEELIRLGLTRGVKAFNFFNLWKGADVAGDFNVYDPTTLPRTELAEGLACLERAIELANSAGGKVECPTGLLDSIRGKLSESVSVCDTHESNPGGGSWRAPGVAENMTRNCSQPWEYAFFSAQGEVLPCCGATPPFPLGDLRTETLDEILNGKKVKQLRQSLLRGDLAGGPCMYCPTKPQIPIGEFRRLMSGKLVLFSLRRRVLNALHVITRN